MFLPKKLLEIKLRRFLEDDVGLGDVTTEFLIPSGTLVESEVIAKESGVIAGLREALTLLESFSLQARPLVPEGSKVEKHTPLLEIIGDAKTTLTIERVLLNLIARMSGIATAISRMIRMVREGGYETRIACTRKVAPGLSYFDKRAVMLGGGDTHRFHLDDLIMIKGNHLMIVDGVAETVKKIRAKISFSKKIEIEVFTCNQALEAAKAGADIIMLDNFSPQQAKETTTLLEQKGLRSKVLIEASGRINAHNILKFAATGVDILSLGEVTDSSKALDMSLEIIKVHKNPKKT